MKKTILFAATGLALALPLPSMAKTYRIAVISDMNQGYGDTEYTPALKKAIQHIRSSGVSAVLSTGDMASGQKTGLNYQAMWNSFHAHVSQPLSDSQIPFLPSPGNHDAAIGEKFAVERATYQRTWQNFPLERFNSIRPADQQIRFMPGVVQNYPLNYAVTMGPALFIAIDATNPSGLINNQMQWLETVLAQSAPYTVKMIFGHFPLYPFTFDRAHEHLARGTESSGFYRRMEDLLEQYQVDMFLSGHHHAFYPGKRLGHTRYVSVPLLGTGARYLLTKDRTEKNRSPQAFLYLEFDDAGNIELQALKSPSMTAITLDSLPRAISIPTRDASDCKGCATFNRNFFIDPSRRVVFNRF